MNASEVCRSRRATLWSAALLGAACAGCTGGLLPKRPPAPSRHTLGEAPVREVPSPSANAPTLIVALPAAAPGFDTTRMVYLRQPQALQAYAFAEWVDTPARLLAPLLVSALQSTGAFGAVLQAPSSATAALRLETELLRLQHDLTQSPSEVRMTLRVVLLNASTRKAVFTRDFDARVPTPSDSPAGCVAAAASATRRLLDELAGYVAGAASRPVAATVQPDGALRDVVAKDVDRNRR